MVYVGLIGFLILWVFIWAVYNLTGEDVGIYGGCSVMAVAIAGAMIGLAIGVMFL